MADDKPPAKLQFHYLKSSDYREVLCHGALGGPTPQGQLWMALYAERFPIPQIVEFDVRPAKDGTVEFDELKSKPTRVETRQGLIRSVEVSAYLDLATAERLHTWLGQQINTMKGKSTT